MARTVRRPVVKNDVSTISKPGDAQASPVRATSAKAQRDAAEEAPKATDDHGAELHVTNDMESMHGEALHEPWPEDWKPPSELQAPPPRPGMTQRWVRLSLMNADDPRNIQKKGAEGWRPRPADTVPADYQAYVVKDQRFGGVISVAGMVLCEMPIRLAKQRNAHYRAKLDRQTRSVDEGLNRVEDPRFVPIKRKRETFVEKGRKPVVQDDAD